MSNKAFNYLPEEVLHRIGTRLGVPYAEVYGAASFYKAFSLEPRGEHIVQVCWAQPATCAAPSASSRSWSAGSTSRRAAPRRTGLFTLETVNCLGACALGPIVAMDGEFHGSMTAAKVPSPPGALREGGSRREAHVERRSAMSSGCAPPSAAPPQPGAHHLRGLHLLHPAGKPGRG